MKAQTTTFAQFTQQDSTQDYVFTNNGSSATFNASSPIFFNYFPSALGGPGVLPFDLRGPQSATLTLTSTTTQVATLTGSNIDQGINQTSTLAIIRDFPATRGKGTRRNLLTVTFQNATISGANGAGSATLSGSTPQIVTFTSDFLDFTGTTARNFSLSFSSVNPTLQINGLFLRNFTAAGTGTFAANPPPTIDITNAVQLVSFDAVKYRGGTVLQWQCGADADNLGFNIYREVDGVRTLVNREVIAGSALFSKEVMSAGYSYAWWDPDAPAGATYYLQDVSLNGRNQTFGPFGSTQVDRDAPFLTKSATLGKITPDSVGDLTLPSFTGKLVQANKGASSPQQAAQFALAAQPNAKISIAQPGWYRISQADLAAAGLPTSFDPRKLQLYLDGRQVPILVSGETDGRFDATDGVEFYATNLDIPSTGTRTYWLTVAGAAGLRVKSGQLTTKQTSANSFSYTVERRDRLVYFPAVLNGDSDNFFGQVISTTPVSTTVNVANVDATAATKLDVSLQGVAGTHNVAVQVNGLSVGSLQFADTDGKKATFTLPAGTLHTGDNTVTFTRQSADTDVSLVDSVRVTYAHTAVADGDRLFFTSAVRQPGQTVSGFTSQDIRAVDVTDPYSPTQLGGLVTRGTNGYQITVGTLSAATPRQVVFSTVAKALHPAAITVNQPSTLNSALGADVVFLTTRALAPSLAPLKALRESQGHTVAIVDVEDVYDEFGFGQRAPAAVKAFLAYARDNWRVAPRYVLFAGDASYDPRNFLGFGDFDLVPTKLIDAQTIVGASDDWFSDFNNDGIPEMVMGRLPVRTPAQADLVVGKILTYESSPTVNHSALLVADANDVSNFEAANETLATSFPKGYFVQQVDRGQVGDAVARQDVLNALNAGPSIVNYVGHGSVDLWRANMLKGSDAATLANGNQLSVYVMANCLNGYFVGPNLDSLSESLLQSGNGGAVAVWSSSAQTFTGEQVALYSEFYRLLFSGEAQTLGEAAARAKNVNVGELRQTWVFLGDPLTRLH